MIPDLPEGMRIKEKLMFYDTLSGNLSDQSSVHMNWHSHRGNPNTCWICDQTTLLSKILNIAFDLITKSTVDIETDEEQGETDIEPEIENDNFENVPEYDVEDDTEVSG